MSFTLNNTDDIIDVRDIISRVEELRNELAELDAGKGDTAYMADGSTPDEAREELAAIEAILADLEGNGGDEQWQGNWYPVTLIRDSYFEQAMDEMLEDCGDLPKDLPCYLSITVDYKALQMDYISTEIDGVTYWYR